MLGPLMCRHFNLRGMSFSDDTHHEGRAIGNEKEPTGNPIYMIPDGGIFEKCGLGDAAPCLQRKVILEANRSTPSQWKLPAPTSVDNRCGGGHHNNRKSQYTWERSNFHRRVECSSRSL